MGKSLRIAGLDRENRLGAMARGGLQLVQSLLNGTNVDRFAAPCLAAQMRQRIDCGLRAPTMIDEFAKRRGPDVLRPDEAQTSQPLRIVELRYRQRCRGKQISCLIPLICPQFSFPHQPRADECWLRACKSTGRSSAPLRQRAANRPTAARPPELPRMRRLRIMRNTGS